MLLEIKNKTCIFRLRLVQFKKFYCVTMFMGPTVNLRQYEKRKILIVFLYLSSFVA